MPEHFHDQWKVPRSYKANIDIIVKREAVEQVGIYRTCELYRRRGDDYGRYNWTASLRELLIK